MCVVSLQVACIQNTVKFAFKILSGETNGVACYEVSFLIQHKKLCERQKAAVKLDSELTAATHEMKCHSRSTVPPSLYSLPRRECPELSSNNVVMM